MDEGRTASMRHPRGKWRTPGERYDAPASAETVRSLSLQRYREEREVVVVARSLQNPKAPAVWRTVRDRGSTLSLAQVRAILRTIYVRTATQRGHARSPGDCPFHGADAPVVPGTMSAINRHDLECNAFEGAAIEEITAALAGRVVAALGVEFAPLLSTPVALATEVMVTTYLADHLCAHHGWSVGAAATYLWQDPDKLSARLRIFHQPPPSWRDRLANSALERSLLALVPARAFPRLKRVQALNASLDRILGTQSMAYQLFAGSSAHDEFIEELRRSCATYGSTGRAVTELEVRGAPVSPPGSAARAGPQC